MANICDTAIAFFSTDSIETLTDFRNMLVSIYKTTNKRTPFTHKYINEKLDLGLKNLEYGDIIDIGEIERTGTCIGFKIWQSDKWTPQLDLWDTLIEKYFTNDDGFRLVDYVYEAEEDGCGVYINTDEGGDFFPDLYKIDAYLPFTIFADMDGYYSEYFDSAYSLIDHLEDILPEIIEWKEIPECRDEDGNPTSWSAEVESPLYGRYIYIDKVSENSYDVVYYAMERSRQLNSDSTGFYCLADAKNWVEDNVDLIFGDIGKRAEFVNVYVESIQKYLKRKYPDDDYYFYVYEFEAE